jgi:alpha-D-ribose 1-methylphosphonate 5-triphosphate diphosphatase
MRPPGAPHAEGREGMELRIEGGRVLRGDNLEDVDVLVSAADGIIVETGDAYDLRALDARGLLVLPGIVDIHGDAFERQMMPRPGVDIALDIALIETDRQVVANGITTVFHGVTWSWEPGLRGAANARAMMDAMEALRPSLAADTRFHLRFETFNFDAEAEVSDWLDCRRIGVLAFNDHLPRPGEEKRPEKLSQMVERSGLSREDFLVLIARLRGRGDEVQGLIKRVAGRAGAAGVPLLSHDDASPQQRHWYRELGCRICEFPMTVDTAREAAAAGDHIVLGAPNVMRGKSHIGWVNASDLIAQGLCSVLASDYYYPAPLVAAFRLAETGIVSFAEAWSLVSGAPACAVKLADRGRIAPGLRGDILLVDATVAGRPRIVAVLVAGKLVYLTEPGRLSGSAL